MCTRPITVVLPRPNPYTGVRTIQVPCGSCAECIRSYQNMWFQRMAEAYIDARYNAYYMTLTYRPQAVPSCYMVDDTTGEILTSLPTDSLSVARCRPEIARTEFERSQVLSDKLALDYIDKRGVKHRVDKRLLSCDKIEVQKFIKQVRERVRRMRNAKGVSFFKYFLTAEYPGYGTALRPHYHIIIYGLSTEEKDLFCSLWRERFGFVKCRKIVFDRQKCYSPEACTKYVSKYVSKSLIINPRVALNRCKPTFHLISKNLGAGYVDRILPYWTEKINAFMSAPDPVVHGFKFYYVVNSSLSLKKSSSLKPYKLCRYYANKILTKVASLSCRTTRSLFIYYTAFKNYLLKINDRLHTQEFEQFQARYPRLSLSQIYAKYSAFQSACLASREENSKKLLERFYNSSITNPYSFSLCPT